MYVSKGCIDVVYRVDSYKMGTKHCKQQNRKIWLTIAEIGCNIWNIVNNIFSMEVVAVF